MDKYITGEVSLKADNNLTVSIDSFSCCISLNDSVISELIDNIDKTMTGEIIEDRRLSFGEVHIDIVPDVYPDRSTWQFIRTDLDGVRGVLFAEKIVELKKELLKY